MVLWTRLDRAAGPQPTSGKRLGFGQLDNNNIVISINQKQHSKAIET
jgi:hypothetical protein